MQYKIVAIDPRIDNHRIVRVVDNQSTEGKEIECCITETSTDLHLITIKFHSDSIPNTFIKTGTNLEDLKIGDILTIEE